STTTVDVTPWLTAAAKGRDDEESKSDEESDDEETRKEESLDLILRTPKDSEDGGNGEEDQGLRISKKERQNEEEEADELYRDVDNNQGRGLQLFQDMEDSHVILTPVNPNGQQESSSVSSQFVTSMLNPTSDAGMESIFVTASSSVAPLPTPTPIITPSIIATITTASQAPIPPTPIPIVSNIPGIVNQYMNQQMNKAVRVAVQIQTDRLRDSYQRENDEFLQTIDDNMKRIIKEQGAEDQPIVQSSQHPEWFSQPKKPPTLDRNWNKTLPAVQGSTQTWISDLEKVDTLTLELLAGPTYELM
nr:hypothetical protein [Tanacetum cinerariifolium]